MSKESDKRNLSRSEADRAKLVERAWTKNQLLIERSKATKALREAQRQEQEKIESGLYHYVIGPMRTMVLVKK